MKILVLANRVPYPLKDGGSLAIFNMLKAYKENGVDVTLLAMNTLRHYQDEIPDMLSAIATIHTVQVDNRIKASEAIKSWLFSSESYIQTRFVSRDYLISLKQLLENEAFDLVQFEGPFLNFCIPEVQKNNIPIIYRAHNLEFEIWEKLASSMSFPKNIWLGSMAKRLRDYEIRSLSLYNAIVSISEEDAQQYRHLGYSGKIKNIPFGVDLKSYKFQEGAVQLAYLGSLEWQPNLEGLNWFLNNVWSLVLEKNKEVSLTVAGRAMPDSLKNSGYEQVEFLGEVEDAQEFLAQYSIQIVPLISGSGMRVKIIEGMAMGKCIVTTNKGAEGIHAKNKKELWISDDASIFAEYISTLLSDETIRKETAENARQFVQKHHDNKTLIADLLSFYEHEIL